MAKLLKALTAVFLLLSAGALALGVMLFQKREILKGRTQKLESALIALAATIEAEEPKASARPDLPARDISPCRAEILDTPELSTFWDTYSYALEEVDRPTLDLSRRKAELMQYYKIDPISRKVERDEYGQKKTSGEGTMQAVIDELQAKAVAQHARLNTTRLQLKNVRNELVNVINEANKNKRDLRSSLVKIEDLNKTVDKLNGQIASLNQQIADLRREVDEQKATVADQKKQIALLEEEKVEKDAQIALLKKEIEKLRLAAPTQPAGAGPVDVASTQAALQQLAAKIQPGNKGQVVAVEQVWSFAILELSDAFMKEILGEDLSGPVPQLELLVKRPGLPGSPDQFVTKVRLVQIKRPERLAIADILTDWTQVPVKEGDLIFF